MEHLDLLLFETKFNKKCSQTTGVFGIEVVHNQKITVTVYYVTIKKQLLKLKGNNKRKSSFLFLYSKGHRKF